jgi:hypothetical protein
LFKFVFREIHLGLGKKPKSVRCSVEAIVVSPFRPFGREHENAKTRCEIAKVRCENAKQRCEIAKTRCEVAKVRCENAILISRPRIVLSRPRIVVSRSRIVFSRFRGLALRIARSRKRENTMRDRDIYIAPSYFRDLASCFRVFVVSLS